MKTYVHNPTEVEAIQVVRPWKGVQDAVPFAHMVKKASGAFDYFKVSFPGISEVERAYEGDWIVKDHGYYEVLTNVQFQYYYGDANGNGD
ncbi:Uncharacterised protein [Mycobacteroides abscessus subsp. abscessus]|uniref:hypothetical protein n=1 Tax=Mycobacteroides abscessus TaxID=36809 RepID=UPI000926464C|nr:hypothetical protein [Mycobacteroides abscessus]SHT12301.1 Uncharacterised protein [Mycobacteroides abscessus subsp. abscessus]SKO61368.1 Uncharacterised protein [Mycobacteroides abscessus subsp. abscessus]SLH92051.1 Uncharacterised protein [Mycobacteroides abscessus subsp. massiliense]SLI31083.1 Uncharacterised protein [Mycobacteroides abscessus subsp. massiliense]